MANSCYTHNSFGNGVVWCLCCSFETTTETAPNTLKYIFFTSPRKEGLSMSFLVKLAVSYQLPSGCKHMPHTTTHFHQPTLQMKGSWVKA